MDKVIEYGGKQVTFCDINRVDHLEGSEHISQGHWYEILTLEFIQGLKVSGNYADVGANIGTHTLFFSLFCPADHVYAFEPHKVAYSKLIKNLAANKIENCTPYNLALSDEAAEGYMYQVSDQAAQAQLAKPTDAPRDSAWVAPIRINDVKIVTLDSLHLDIKLLKVDVEGHQFEVLKGAKETLKLVDHLIVEVWDNGFGCNVNPWVRNQSKELVAFLQEQGLVFKQLTPGDNNNWYFCREEKKS
jgi:FkbM family methyltransferase